MGMLVEEAGVKAVAGIQRILDICPEALHQRTSVVLGSPGEVDRVTRFLADGEAG